MTLTYFFFHRFSLSLSLFFLYFTANHLRVNMTIASVTDFFLCDPVLPRKYEIYVVASVKLL